MNSQNPIAVVLTRYTKPEEALGIHLLTPNPDFDPEFTGFGHKAYPYHQQVVGLFRNDQSGYDKLQSLALPEHRFDQKWFWTDIKDELDPVLRRFIIRQVLPMEWQQGFEENDPELLNTASVFIWEQHKYSSLVLDEV